MNNNDRKIVCNAIVTKKLHTTFTGLPLKTSKHETYSRKKQQRKVFSGYYAYLNRPTKDSDPFLILEFMLVK